MEYKLQSLESDDRIDHQQGTCRKCSQVHKRYFIFVCLVCAFFALINFLVLIYALGRLDVKVEADVLKQLHTLQARVQALEAISSGSLSAVNEARHEFVDLADQKKYISSWNVSPGGREKRGARVHKNKRRKHKQHKRKPKTVEAIQIEGELNNAGIEFDHWAYENLSGTFHKWKFADWFFKLKESVRGKQFTLDFKKGCLTVKQDGLYLLYSQITLKGNGTQGYHVMKNDEAVLACYSNNMMLHDEDKTSCFTMGIFKVDKNDTISIRHISTSGVKAVFTSNASFFGMIKLGRFNKKNDVLIAV